MRKAFLTFILFVSSFLIQAQEPFVFTWEASTSNNLSVVIPTEGEGYNYIVDFGDGTVVENVTGNITHQYSSEGIYTISITGNFPRIYVDNCLCICKILSIEQWGDIQWESMNNAFTHCADLVINATDSPNLSQVTDLSYMFFGATALNQSINHWDVSNITSMQGLFYAAINFNQPLDNWDVSNVTDMSYMFIYAKSFNQNINSWDVSNVTNMSRMFNEAIVFNQPLDNWDVSNVTNMSAMFQAGFQGLTSNFNQPLNSWDVSNVTSMSGMFNNLIAFNQPLDNWDVSSVINMGSMFSGAESFNQPLNNWDVSSVINMGSMFSEAESFNQPLNNWDVSNVTNMSYMFFAAAAFNQPLNNWDIFNVTDTASMFAGAVNFNNNLNNWDVSSVIDMGSMFSGAESFNQPLNDWDVSNVTNMFSMFSRAESFNQPLNDWDVSSVEAISGFQRMFYDATSFNQPLYSWDVSNAISDFPFISMFEKASSFNQDISSWEINSGVLTKFLSESGMDVNNYDAVLNKLALIGISGGNLGALNLEYCNQAIHSYLTNDLGWTITGDSLNPYCNSIYGTVLFDSNNNGCNINDIPINGLMVTANDGVLDFSTFVNDGNYELGTYGTSFSVSTMGVPEYFTVTPESVNVVFSGSNTEEVNFCLTANQSVEDLNITILPINEARPGFESDYRLVVRNVGTETIQNVEVTLTFDDAMQEFVSAVPNPGSTTNNSLTFNIGEILPFGIANIDVTMETFQPPIVEGGDILNFTAVVTPDANDYTPEDNTYQLEQIVVNSFDPNDKLVLQGDEVHINNINKYLDYVIRFQNTGTASAINVRILDTLHPKLNYNTFTPISASHDYYIQITNQNQVEFIFNNIHLPHEGANEPESHGFVAFKIKPKSDVQVGDIISGDAAIYFDFNPPIITDMVYTEIVDFMDVSDPEHIDNGVSVFPNPTKNFIHIKLNGSILMEEIIMYNIQGRETLRSFEKDISLENLESGIYILKILTNQGNVFRKIVKQ